MMQPGEQIGPFTIDKLIGAGAMGAVYRGTSVKSGRKVAIKLMLPGAAENAQSADRFHREIEILKQLNHPNIVRLLYEGEYKGARFYAMDYIQGESLDKTLSRRGRFSWEDVVALGQHLCAALQHAHDKGVVHRDLKPANLMILADGTLKLTDFGIAKDLDVTQLTEANCTVGTASYMSPEQCRGERNLTFKSDLYSLGIVFYELLTGKKPFISDNVMDMFMQHVKGTFERPSRIIVDIPKWLDVLVCQLMEKKPEKRPRDAATVSQALAEVLEKVEARQSAGVETARAGGVAAADETTAFSLLEKKKKKKPKKQDRPSTPWHQRTGVKAAGLLLALAAVVLVGWLILKPVSQEQLYNQIETLMASNDPKKEKEANKEKGPIRAYLRRFGSLDDERTKRVRQWREGFELLEAEEELTQSVAAAKTIGLNKMDALSEAGRKAVKAAQAEEEGDLTAARSLWNEVSNEPGSQSSSWGKLAERRLNQQFKAVEELTAGLEQGYVKQLLDFPNDPLKFKSPSEEKAFKAFRYEDIGDLSEARQRWRALKEETQSDPLLRLWFLLAASRTRLLDNKLKENADKMKSRIEIVKEYLKKTEEERIKTNVLGPASVRYRTIIELYGSDKEFNELVDEAKKLRSRL